MADRTSPQPTPPTPITTTTTTTTGPAHFLHRLHTHRAINSTQLIGLLTLLISGGILLLLTGVTLTAFVSGLVFFGPIILLSSPFWFPIAAVFFFFAAGFLSLCGLGVGAIAAVSWLYRYSRGLHPPGADRFDYARTRLVDTAREVKDYAREYGGYLHSKVKDAAPGA